jgi:hypothetical protein
VQTTIKNVEYSDIQKLIENDLVTPRDHRYINNPMILSRHWPRPYEKHTSSTSEDVQSSPLTEEVETSTEIAPVQ